MFEPDNEQLQQVIMQNDLQDELASLTTIISDETHGVELNPLGIFCQKTGHCIGIRSEISLFSLIKNAGKNAIIPMLYNSPGLNTHPLWVETNGAKLDILIEQDPIGYACYMFGIITGQHYQSTKNQNHKLQPWSEKYWALARANALLTTKGVAELAALNLELCRIVTFMPDTTAYLLKRIRKLAHTPDSLAMLHCTGELTGLLKEATNRALDSIGSADNYIKRTRFIDFALTPADAARGPSNVRQQKSSKRDVKEATMFSALSALFKDAGLDIKSEVYSNTPGTSQWKERFRSNQQMRDDAILSNLKALSNLNLDELEEDEDNEVEMRRLAVMPSHENIEVQGCEAAGTEPQSIIENTAINNINNEIHDVGNEIMAEISKQVLENVPQIHKEKGMTAEQVMAMPEYKPMTAMERFRAKQKGNL